MKYNHYIYNNVPEIFLEEAGFFVPNEEPLRLSENSYIKNVNNKVITEDTLVLYFPGSFGCFHKGHMDIVHRAVADAKNITDDYVLVLSPANSDYAIDKYGYSNFATNKFRYERIMEQIKDCGYNIIVDLNPMLNYTVDHNFTDLLKWFCDYEVGVNIDELKYAPVIVGGKDRDFSIINDLTNLIQFWYYDQQVDFSTSGNYKPEQHTKHDVLVRVHNDVEFDLFVRYFSSYYNEIKPIYIKDEIKQLKKLDLDKCITICKDYVNYCHYVKLSRTYETPLDKPTFTEEDRLRFSNFYGFTAIDSDIFSGGTRDFLNSVGIKTHAFTDLSKTDNTELLDIDDFKCDNYCYPYIDVASKCSLPAFDCEMHKHYNSFITELKNLEK